MKVLCYIFFTIGSLACTGGVLLLTGLVDVKPDPVLGLILIGFSLIPFFFSWLLNTDEKRERAVAMEIEASEREGREIGRTLVRG